MPRNTDRFAPPPPDQRLSLAQAARFAAVEGKPPHPSTVFRWTQGIRGVRLQHWRIGRRIVTNREALDRFFVGLSRAAEAEQARRDQRRRHPDGHAYADRVLAGVGDVDAACRAEGL